MMNAFDRDGICVAWNGECERVTGYSAEEMIGTQNVHELTMPDPTYRARMLEVWSSKRDARDREVELTAKDGRILTIAWSNISENFAIRDWSTWSIGVDVTERNRVEAALEKSRGELEQKVTLRTLGLDNANAHLRVEKNTFKVCSIISRTESRRSTKPGSLRRSTQRQRKCSAAPPRM